MRSVLDASIENVERLATEIAEVSDCAAIDRALVSYAERLRGVRQRFFTASGLQRNEYIPVFAPAVRQSVDGVSYAERYTTAMQRTSQTLRAARRCHADAAWRHHAAAAKFGSFDDDLAILDPTVPPPWEPPLVNGIPDDEARSTLAEFDRALHELVAEPGCAPVARKMLAFRRANDARVRRAYLVRLHATHTQREAESDQGELAWFAIDEQCRSDRDFIAAKAALFAR